MDPVDVGRAAGDALAAEVQFEIVACGLEGIVTATYAADSRAVRLIWTAADRTLDFPAREEWSERLRRAFPTYARNRQRYLEGAGH